MLMSVLSPEQAWEFMLLDEYNKGKEQGIEQGRHNNCLDIAKNMLKNNFSIDNISLATGLSKEEIKTL